MVRNCRCASILSLYMPKIEESFVRIDPIPTMRTDHHAAMLISVEIVYEGSFQKLLLHQASQCETYTYF